MDILVLGIGNVLMGDEGIGVHAINYLEKHTFPSNVRLLDGGTGGFHLLEYLQDYKKIIMIDTAIVYKPTAKKINVDYIVISKNPGLYINQLAEVFNCNLYIFDSSNPMWKIDKWKKDCEELHLPFHSVPEQGAIITDL